MNKKIALITGASSGIGRASLCARRGERIQQLTEELKEQYAVEIFPLQLDVREKKTVNLMDALPAAWHHIDLLINNAGLAAGLGPLHTGSAEDWDQMIDTNIKGLLWVSRAVIPGMIERKQGHIINIGSIAGKETYVNGGVYCATKHAVDSLTKAMRMELVKHGIKVSQVAPGAVETEFARVRLKGDEEAASKVYAGYKPLQAEDVADAIYYIASLPQHVCINDMLIMPTAQANTIHWNRE
jgi:3-hydroxy acid dehydrogenase/malonic semialdehyde reductase